MRKTEEKKNSVSSQKIQKAIINPSQDQNLTNHLPKHITTVPDDVHSELLEKLPQVSPEYLLDIYNKIRVNGKVLYHLKTNRIPKLSKGSNDETNAHKPKIDSTNPSNHRPIALTRCICKILERRINDRLTSYN